MVDNIDQNRLYIYNVGIMNINCLLTLPKFLTRKQQESLNNSDIKILERMYPGNKFRCEVTDFVVAIQHELVEKMIPWFEEPYITQATQNLSSDTFITFDILLHQVSNLTSMKTKLESFGLEFIFRNDSRKIRIVLLYPKQKALLSKINECDEVDSVVEYVPPTIF